MYHLLFYVGVSSENACANESTFDKKKEFEMKSVHDNDEDGVNIFKSPEGRHGGLKISKVLFITGLSILDVITDILFGIREALKNFTLTPPRICE